MKILYSISKILTFPGGFLRGFWEQLMCKIFGAPVENKKYFQFNEMCGHVEHEPIKSASKSFWFCFVSGMLVFLAGLIFAVPAVINLFCLDVTNSTMKITYFIFLYFAFSMLTNIFPSVEDALMMWEGYKGMKGAGKIIFAPGAAIMYVGAYAESYCITFLTNLALVAMIIFC